MNESTTHDTSEIKARWQDKTLKAAGYGYLIGDAAFAASGLIKGKAGGDIFRAGAIWAAGGVGAAVYGNPGFEKQLEILAYKLEHHLSKRGAIVTDDIRDRATLLRGKNTLGATLDRFMHEHPTELLNVAYAVGAVGLLHDGLKDFGNKKITTAMGALVLAGALSGLLIKEDSDAQSKVDQSSIISRVTGFIKEKPMRLSSTLYCINNGFGFANALKDKKAYAHAPCWGIKAHWMSFLTVAAYVVSNGLLALSSRDQIEEQKFKPEHVAQLEQVAAEIIAAQPPQLQGQLLTSVSHYLAKEKMVAIPPEELSRQLMARVSEASRRHLAKGVDNCWAGRVDAPYSTAITI